MAAEISFIIPLFNHLEQTLACLSTLRASIPEAFAHEIILVDDFSTDGTRKWLISLDDPGIKIILNARNLGYARSNNIGVESATGKILCLLNNDLCFSPDWLEPMLGVFDSPELNAGIVGNVQYRIADGALDHAGVTLSPAGKFEHIRKLPEEGQMHTKVLAVTGACLMIRKTDFIALGGLDETYVNGGEDIDLCFAMRTLRKHIYVAATSYIQHHVSLSRDRASMQNEHNSRYLFKKWRKQVRQELSTRWSWRLQLEPDAYKEYIDGTLHADFLASPQLAAQIIAESMIKREEARWIRELDQVSINQLIVCKAKGLAYDQHCNGYFLHDDAEIFIPNLSSARNIFVCGRFLSELKESSLVLIISINGIHEQTFRLEPGRNFNVGIRDPLLLQGAPNSFTIRAFFVDLRGQRTDGRKSIVLTHIVVDDQMISDFI